MVIGNWGVTKVVSARSVVNSFLSALSAGVQASHSLALTISNDEVLKLTSAGKKACGRDWISSIKQGEKFDFVVADLPLGMGRKKAEIAKSIITVRQNWSELAKALELLDHDGLCVALVEPPAFGIAEGPKFLRTLESEGYNLRGVFNVPPNLLSATSIRPVLVVFSRGASRDLFVAELEGEARAIAVADRFLREKAAESLAEGIYIQGGSFDGFESLNAKLQLERLETQYKEYVTYTLRELADEFISVRSGQKLEHKANSIYIPMLGSSNVTHDLSAITLKHHNVVQVVLSDMARSPYVSAFFRSDLGVLILRSLTRGAVIPKVNKSDLEQARVALPNLPEQDEIVHSHEQLSSLSAAMTKFQKELALNPRSASAIRSRVESMLEQIGELTDVDRIMSMAREGESATVEFKESFGLDLRKGTKEKYIELSALKTIVAFLNTTGGVLLVGVTDAGITCGVGKEIEKLHKKNKDGFLLHVKNQIKQRVGEQYYPFIDQRLVDLGEVWVLIVNCQPASTPCYLDGRDFYVRTNPATDKLEGPKLVEYVQNHFQR